MAKDILKNVSILHGGFDLTSITNQISLGLSKGTPDVTTFGSDGWKEFLPELADAAWEYNGFHDTDFDEALFDAATVTTPVPTLCTLSRPIVAGDIAYAMNAIGSQYTRGETIGQAASYKLGLKGNAATTRGKILEAVTSGANGNSAVQQRSATLSTQLLHAWLFVLDKSGTSPTLDVLVQSDDASGFASATTRITFDQMTTVGAQYKSLAGPITDDYFRTARTIGGTGSPSFTYVVMLAIQ